MPFSPTTSRRIARTLSAGRIAIGAVGLLSPRTMTRSWVGEQREPAGQLLARGLAGRDVALGVGCMLSLDHDGATRGWLEGAALADLVDAAATALYFRWLPKRGRSGVLAVAAGSAVLGALAARGVDSAG